MAAKSKNKKDQRLLKQFEEHLQTIAMNKDFNEGHLKELVEKGRKTIEQLSERLKL
jgi:ribonuclease PH